MNPSDPNSIKTDKDDKKAEILASFFSSVFTWEPEGDLPEFAIRRVTSPMEYMTITTEDIVKVLKKIEIDTRQISRHGQNPPSAPKRNYDNNICTPLEIIFNKSLQIQKIPEEWKKAQISAI